MKNWFFRLTVLLAFSASTMAHENRPINIQLSELQQNHFRLHWRTPESVGLDNAPTLSLRDCKQLEGSKTDALVGMVLYRCGTQSGNRMLDIGWPDYNPSVSALVRVNLFAGEKYTRMLAPDELSWEIPAGENFRDVAYSYFVLGVLHILSGIDHLLFLACLCFIAGSLKRVLITVTGFTLAHSLTLALSALNILDIPIAPTEAAIALSILFLVREISLDNRKTLTWRFPILVSSSFGLLHGLGFASALSEIGLPQTQRLSGLLMFNVGVEAGQIIVVATGGALVFFWQRHLTNRVWSNVGVVLRQCSIALIGLLSAYWLIDRSLIIPLT